MENCVICKEPLDNGKQTVVLRGKGSDGINNASELREDSIHTSAGQSVHQKCRQEYCNKNVTSRDLKRRKEEATTTSRSLRSQESPFRFSEHCIFCGQPAKCSERKRDSGIFPVRTEDFQSTIERACAERGDSWAQIVHSRIEFAQDLHAVDAVYHQVCSINFRTGKQQPSAYPSTLQGKRPRLGRPIDSSKEDALLEVAEYLKGNDDEQITVSDLVQKMGEFRNDDSDVYSVKHMKNKLDHFANDIVITSINGKADVVTFRSTASNLLRSFYEAPKLVDAEAEKMRIVKTAADLIKNDIKCRQTSRSVYPSPDDISSLHKNRAFVPEYLRILLGTIFSEEKTELKIASIGQTIVQAARPRVLTAPLQIGLAVQMHHHFGSKFLIDSLNSHGFCSSYSEVKRFEMCAAQSQGTEIPGITSGHFVQYVADNADHNIRTLDGQNTFPGMGIIAAVTPGTKRQIPVPRCSAKAADVADVGKIHIHFYKGPCGTSLSLVYKKLRDLRRNDPTWKLDLLWKVVWPFRSPRPGWSGMMQAVSQGTYPGKSSVMFLPMIDMNASDMSCVYSTLRFVVAECKRHQTKPILTFDQPLWWKAQLIVANEPIGSDLSSLILRLGGFHTEMSFLGCIGNVISASGLEELLEVVYAQNTVGHMLSGKALARAVRGHFLVDVALHAIVTAETFNVTLPLPGIQLAENIEEGPVEEHELIEGHMESELSETPPDMPGILQKAIQLYDKLIAGEVNAEAVCSEHLLDEVHEKLKKQKAAMASHPTARLWVQLWRWLVCYASS